MEVDCMHHSDNGSSHYEEISLIKEEKKTKKVSLYKISFPSYFILFH